MKINPALFFAFTLLGNSATSGCSAPSDGVGGREELPRRSECIVLAETRTNGLVDSYQMTGLLEMANKANMPLAGYTIRKEGLYFQFASKCESKMDMALSLLEELGQARPSTKGLFKLSHGTITPSAETIDIRGDSWAD